MSEERKIKFKYIFPEDYNPVYCNGAYGGISTRGEIVANFFFERLPLPNSMTNLVNQDGTIGGVSKTDPEDLNEIILRHIVSGVILTEENAKSIYEWLGTQLQELENRKAMNSIEPTEGE